METTQKNNTANNTKKVDLNALSKLSESFAVSEKIVSSSKDIYNEKLFVGLTSKEEKRKRAKLRNQLDDFSIEFLRAVRAKDENKLNKISLDFLKFYKENYRNLDFSLASVRSNVKNEDDRKRLELFMNTMKQINEK